MSAKSIVVLLCGRFHKHRFEIISYKTVLIIELYLFNHLTTCTVGLTRKVVTVPHAINVTVKTIATICHTSRLARIS